MRPEFPPGELSPEVHRRIREILQQAKSFTVINLPKPNVPDPMAQPKTTITYTDPVYQGPSASTTTSKSKPPPPKLSPQEAGAYHPSPPPSRQHEYKTPPETPPVYTAHQGRRQHRYIPVQRVMHQGTMRCLSLSHRGHRLPHGTCLLGQHLRRPRYGQLHRMDQLLRHRSSGQRSHHHHKLPGSNLTIHQRKGRLRGLSHTLRFHQFESRTGTFP